MQPSDFLTILGLAIAVWSIIPNKERNFILLFFSNFELIVLGVSLLFLHYLMAFDWLQQNWFQELSVFTFNTGVPAATWAYVFGLIIITVPVLKVSFSYFSASRLKDLISLYRSLLKENEIDLLVSYINKYHLDDIQIFLKGLSDLPEEEDLEIAFRLKNDSEASDKAYEKLIKPKRIRFASWVYGNIIQNDLFVNAAATKYPELFAKVFRGMETEKAANQDLVKLYIERIFETKNQSFIQELKIANDAYDSIKERDERVALPILYSLFANTEAAAANYVWYPVGEGAIKSLKFDGDQNEFLKKEYDDDLEPELWNYKVYIAMIYFKYMVRESIYRDSGWHMWLFYFRQTTDLLIQNIPNENNYNPKAEYPSFAHFLLSEQLDIMHNWLQLARKLNTEHRVIDTIRCLGSCIYSVCQADEKKISFNFKIRKVKDIIFWYFEFDKYQDNIAAKTAREWLKKLFKNPKNVDYNKVEVTAKYFVVLREAWNEFDKMRYDDYGDRALIKEFETEVLAPLGIEV